MTNDPGNAAKTYGDHRDLITPGLLADVLDVFARHGIDRCDADPVRLAYVLEAICQLAERLAGPLPISP